MDVKAFIAALTADAQDALYEHYRHQLYLELRDSVEDEGGVLEVFCEITGEPGEA